MPSTHRQRDEGAISLDAPAPCRLVRVLGFEDFDRDHVAETRFGSVPN
jgi:hypothetical protein